MFEKSKSAGHFGLIALTLAGLSFSSLPARAGGGESTYDPRAFAAALAVPNQSIGPLRFASPQVAESALAAAAKAGDANAVRAIFGPELRDLVSPDAVQAANGFSNFVRRVGEKVELAPQSDSNIVLQIGAGCLAVSNSVGAG